MNFTLKNEWAKHKIKFLCAKNVAITKKNCSFAHSIDINKTKWKLEHQLKKEVPSASLCAGKDDCT